MLSTQTPEKARTSGLKFPSQKFLEDNDDKNNIIIANIEYLML